jgi:hypothetical protein
MVLVVIRLAALWKVQQMLLSFVCHRLHATEGIVWGRENGKLRTTFTEAESNLLTISRIVKFDVDEIVFGSAEGTGAIASAISYAVISALSTMLIRGNSLLKPAYEFRVLDTERTNATWTCDGD